VTRKVTPQRKQNNRKAQQRYREKRKAQAADMEQRVAALTSELEMLQAFKARASTISGENEQLRNMLQQQTVEIERLKVRPGSAARCARLCSFLSWLLCLHVICVAPCLETLERCNGQHAAVHGSGAAQWCLCCCQRV
jgi:Basic region leucine zipper